MSWTRWFSRLLGSRPRYSASRRSLRAKYDAAQTNADNQRHWANADNLSAVGANSPAVRRTLRNRCRYECANNSYAAGIALTVANDLIGTGPRLQIETTQREGNRQLRDQWSAWSRAVRLAEKLRVMRQARMRDGEAFAILVSNPLLPTEQQLDLRLIEAEQVDEIEYDAVGNPTRYQIFDVHPSDGQSQAKPYDAASVIHWYRIERPGQLRGIPELTPALGLFANLRRYTEAVIAAAETAADFAAILFTTTAPDGAAEVDPFLEIQIEKRMLTTVPEGWQLAQMKAEQPTTTQHIVILSSLNHGKNREIQGIAA
ncbi:MAG: phage portal protein [Pirellulales bacterium]|nr:phage portal protein [Pirellulales bacterium]